MKKGLMKVVALAAASVMAVAALAGCGSSDKLIMGTNAAFPPFEYTTSQGLVGEFDGIDVAIANKIAENVGKELQIEDMEFDSILPAVQGPQDILFMMRRHGARCSLGLSGPRSGI